MFCVTSVIGMKYLYVDRAKIFFFSKMLRFRHQGYQMKALLKVDEEYQISDIYSLDFTIFSSKIKKISSDMTQTGSATADKAFIVFLCDNFFKFQAK